MEHTVDSNPPSDVANTLRNTFYDLEECFVVIPDLRKRKFLIKRPVSLQIQKLSECDVGKIRSFSYCRYGFLVKLSISSQEVIRIFEKCYQIISEDLLTATAISLNMPYGMRESLIIERIFVESSLNMLISHDAGSIMIIDKTVEIKNSIVAAENLTREKDVVIKNSLPVNEQKK